MEKFPCVYILASQFEGSLYIGVTSNLPQRVWQHKNKVVAGFTDRYNIQSLVWFEAHDTIENAIRREKALKGWNRKWKIRLIRKMNPDWKDLAEGL